MAKPKKFVVVEWEDISGEEDGWLDVKKAQDTPPTLVWSIGWIYRENNTYVYLAMDWCDDDSVHQRGKISKSVIRHVKELPFPRNFKPKAK